VERWESKDNYHWWDTLFMGIGEVDENVDYIINALIDRKAKVVRTSRYTVTLDGVRVWISNYPYGYGSLYQNRYFLQTEYPFKKTRVRLRDYLNSQISVNYDKAIQETLNPKLTRGPKKKAKGRKMEPVAKVTTKKKLH